MKMTSVNNMRNVCYKPYYSHEGKTERNENNFNCEKTRKNGINQAMATVNPVFIIEKKKQGVVKWQVRCKPYSISYGLSD